MDEQGMLAVESIIQAVDEEGPATAEQQAQQAQQDDAESQAREWGSIAFMVGQALAMLAPELRQVYTEQACMAWGTAVVPVSQKYGWGNPTNVPEVGLAIATLGLAVPSVLLIRRNMQAMRAAKQQQQRPDTDTASATVQPSPVPTQGATGGG